MPSFETLASFWSGPVLATNVLVLMHLVGSMLLGLLVGYERSYHGRAAGMRTYGLVCMAATALTVISGYSSAWFGGTDIVASGTDATRVIQGIVSGIGFLCAGVIMREGFNISGLTTAASLWAAAVIGIVVGVGFYVAAIALAVLTAICMAWISKLEAWLPSRQAVAIYLKFKEGVNPDEIALRGVAKQRGYDVASGTISISCKDACTEWNFVAVAHSRQKMGPIAELALEMARLEGVTAYRLGYARN